MDYDKTIKDPRIRMELGNYRVIAPSAKRSGTCEYLNDSKLIIEKKDCDALGTEQWTRVGEVRHPGNRLDSPPSEYDLAIWTLLAQDGN